MPAVPAPARRTASSTIDAIPCRSMSFIVNTCTWESRTAVFSRSSRLRTPRRTGCRGADRPGGEAVIAAEEERYGARPQGGERRFVQLAAGFRDVVDVFLVFVSQMLRLANGRRKIALVDDQISQFRNALADAGNS